MKHQQERKMLNFWNGKPIEELSREELVEALTWAATEIEKMRSSHSDSLRIFTMALSAKK